MVDWALSFWVNLATALFPECRSGVQVRNAGKSARIRALRLRLTGGIRPRQTSL